MTSDIVYRKVPERPYELAPYTFRFLVWHPIYKHYIWARFRL